MGQRTRYPQPECPKCGNSGHSFVKNTYYSVDNEIVRMRGCKYCGWKWWTIQPIEENLLPNLYQLSIPRFSSTDSKRITITKL